MSSQWLQTDIAGLGLLAMLYDDYYRTPDVEVLKEIRLQRQCFGLTPLDRSRLQWEVTRASEAEQKQVKREMSPRRTGTHDPRRILSMVKK